MYKLFSAFMLALLLAAILFGTAACGGDGVVAVDPTDTAEGMSCDAAHTDKCDTWSASEVASCLINANTQAEKDVCKLHKP